MNTMKRVQTYWLCGFVTTIGATPILMAQERESFFQLEEVVVTARKRSESLMETPISITAFSETELDLMQIESASEIASHTPNLVFSKGSATSGDSSVGVIFIRGIGQTDHVPTVEPGVGLYVDDVYISQAQGSVFKLIDVESIQVLRGPQGTLFGRNTIGGAVLVYSKKPSEEFQGEVKVTVGEYDRTDFSGKVNLPLTDSLFAKVSAIRTKRDGYIDRIFVGDETGDDDTVAARLALRWLPSDSLDINLSVDYSKSENNGPAVALARGTQIGNNGFVAHHNFVKVPTSVSPVVPYDNRFVSDKYSSFGSKFQDSENEVRGANFIVEWDISDTLSFKSISNYRDMESQGGLDDDNSPLRIRGLFDWTEHDQFTQELQLTGEAWEGRVNWLAGYYYFEEEATNINLVEFSPVGVTSGALTDNKSEAIFAQATTDVTEQFIVTAGLRYTEEEKIGIVDDQIQWVASQYNPELGAYVNFPPNVVKIIPNGESKQDDDSTDPYLNLAYHWSEDLMTYFTYSEGFKGGGFLQRNVARAPALEEFGPEFATVYEVGFKLSALDNRLRLTGALFHTDYEDIQTSVEEIDAGSGAAITKTKNAGDATFQGGELELTASPSPAWRITAGIGYVDGEYESLSAEAIASGIGIDNDFPFVSEWQTNASATYTIPAFSGELISRVDWSYRSEFNTTANNFADNEQSGYSLFNASTTYYSPSERWQVSLGIKNLGDEYYATNFAAFFEGEGYTSMFVGPPREWSASFKYLF